MISIFTNPNCGNTCCGGFIMSGSFTSYSLKAGVHMKAVFWLVIMALTQISRLRFKQSSISLLIPHIYVSGRFEFFLVINSFSQRISKIYGNRNFAEQLSNNLGCHCGVRQLSGGVLYLFFPFNPSLNFLKFHLNSCSPPP